MQLKILYVALVGACCAMSELEVSMLDILVLRETTLDYWWHVMMVVVSWIVLNKLEVSLYVLYRQRQQ